MPFPQGARWAVFSGVGNFTDSGVEVFRAPRVLEASGQLEQEDHQQLVVVKSADNTNLTIPTGFHAGFRTTIVQAGEGEANVIAADGVTLEPSDMATAGKGSICLLLAIADDNFLLGGDTGPAAPVGEGGTQPAPGPAAPPVNRDVPYVSGAGTVGETLSCTMGNWDNTPDSYSYRWLGNSITELGSDDSYTIVASDSGLSITCVVTATNALGSTAAPPSNAVTVA